MQAKDIQSRVREATAGLKAAASNLTRFQTWVIVLLVALTALGGVITYFRSRPREVKVEGAAGKTGERNRELTVHVAGAVSKPGLYRLPEGSRVADALEKAGGASTDAVLDNVNLAARLTDGQKVMVARAQPPQQQPSAGAAPAAGKTPAQGGTLININSASAVELETLPGIGPSMSKRIIDYREKNGSFNSVEDLDDVEGIGPRKLESLKDLVTI